MKRLFSVILATLLVLGFVGMSFADGQYTTQNASIMSGNGGPAGVTPMTELIRVRYGRMGPNILSLNSGDVVTWDIVSKDGITISLCTVSNDGNFAGVLVTPIASAESTNVLGAARNWGYMAIRGYCLASVDTTNSRTGGPLYQMAEGRFGTVGGALNPLTQPLLSQDIGVLLNNTGTLGLMPVILR